MNYIERSLTRSGSRQLGNNLFSETYWGCTSAVAPAPVRRASYRLDYAYTKVYTKVSGYLCPCCFSPEIAAYSIRHAREVKCLVCGKILSAQEKGFGRDMLVRRKDGTYFTLRG